MLNVIYVHALKLSYSSMPNSSKHSMRKSDIKLDFDVGSSGKSYILGCTIQMLHLQPWSAVHILEGEFFKESFSIEVQ